MARCERTQPPERVELVFFYESELGLLIYSWEEQVRRASLWADKDVFGIDPLPVREGHKAKVFVLLSVLLSDDGVSQPSDRQSTGGGWHPDPGETRSGPMRPGVFFVLSVDSKWRSKDLVTPFCQAPRP